MTHSLLLRPLPLAIAASLCLAAPVPAVTTVFEIGVFGNSPTQAEFEQESDAFNDPAFYYEPGDYTAVVGKAGPGIIATQAEILADGPTSAEWGNSLAGFPRALVPGRPIIDIFFQLTEEEAQAPWLQFETLLTDLGGDSSHDVTFFLNDVPFFTQDGITASLPVNVSIPSGYVAGPNVISLVRDGGGDTNPWIQFDALRLTAVPEPAAGAFALAAAGMLALRRRRA